MQNRGLHSGDISEEKYLIVEMENIKGKCHFNVYSQSVFCQKQPPEVLY